MISSSSIDPLERPGTDTRALVAAPGLWTRAWQTFFAPRRLFDSLGPASPWVGVLLLSTVVAMIAAVNHPPNFFLDQMEDPVNRLGRPVEVTSSPEAIVRYGRYLAAMSALAAHPLLAFAVGAGVTLLFTVLGRGRGSFRHYLVASSHVLLIPALGTLVALALRAGTGNPGAEPTVAQALSFAGQGIARNTFLGNINLFSVWMLCALAFAVAAYDGKRTRLQATGAMLGCYLLLAAVSSLLTS